MQIPPNIQQPASEPSVGARVECAHIASGGEERPWSVYRRKSSPAYSSGRPGASGSSARSRTSRPATPRSRVRLIGTDVDKFGDYYLFIDEHENDYVRILSTELGIDQWEMGLGDAVEMCKTTSDASIIMGYGFAMLRGEMKIEGIQRCLVTL